MVSYGLGSFPCLHGSSFVDVAFDCWKLFGFLIEVWLFGDCTFVFFPNWKTFGFVMMFWRFCFCCGFPFIVFEYGVFFGKRASFACAKVPPFSAWCFRICFVLMRIGHSLEVPVWPASLQFGQKGVLLQLSCGASPQRLHLGVPLHLFWVCPIRWHL